MSFKNNAETLLRQGFAGQAQRRRAEAEGGDSPLRLSFVSFVRFVVNRLPSPVPRLPSPVSRLSFVPFVRFVVSRLPPPLRLCASALNRLPSPVSRLPRHRAAFTLVEMLSVVVIISLLAGATGMALAKARELSRRTRAEAELREMIAGWLQYHQLYQELPGVVRDKNDLPANKEILKPLIDPESPDNPRGLVLLNPKLPFNDQGFYTDPWGTPYQLSFAQSKKETAVTAMRTSITFPGRQRRFP